MPKPGLPGFPERLQLLRLAAGESRSELAEALRVSTRNVVAGWETGRTAPRLDSLVALAEHYHCSLDELVLGRARPTRRLPDNVRRLHPTPQQALGDALAILQDNELEVAQICSILLLIVPLDDSESDEHCVWMTEHPHDLAGRLQRLAGEVLAEEVDE